MERSDCVPSFVEPAHLTSGYGLACEVYVLELDRCQHPEGAVPALAIVEDLEVLEHRVGQFDPRFPSWSQQVNASPTITDQPPEDRIATVFDVIE